MESFFSSLKTERTARKVYRTRNEARADVFDYIERFYNPMRRTPFQTGLPKPHGVRGPSYANLTLCPRNRQQATILLLLIAASFYSRMLAIAGLPNAIAGLVTDSGFGPLSFLFIYAVIILLMGMILDSTSILLIMVPIAAPIPQGLGLDLMHFGIVTVIAVEIGLLTPPFGISVFTVHNTLNDPNVSVEQIFAATLPFIAVMLVVLVIVALVPVTATVFL